MKNIAKSFRGATFFWLTLYMSPPHLCLRVISANQYCVCLNHSVATKVIDNIKFNTCHMQGGARADPVTSLLAQIMLVIYQMVDYDSLHQACGHLSSCRTLPLFSWYQLVLLGNRTYVKVAVQQCPTTSWSHNMWIASLAAFVYVLWQHEDCVPDIFTECQNYGYVGS